MNDLVDRDRQHDASVATARRGSLDDSAYYQAQVDSLNRDNRMLRARIRVLERQIAELHSSAAAAAGGGGAAADTETAAAAAAATGDGAAHDEPAAEKTVTG